jgi:membrane protein YdbS with pleckstrin-like domain
MSVKRFRSKVDTWLVFAVVAALVVLAVALVSMVVAGGSFAAIALFLGVMTAVTLFIGLIFTRTWYEIDARELRIVSGPFRWTIPRESIRSIEDSRNPLSSPALSLDRLRIGYGDKRWILVSPEDKKGFRKALGEVPGRARE